MLSSTPPSVSYRCRRHRHKRINIYPIISAFIFAHVRTRSPLPLTTTFFSTSPSRPLLPPYRYNNNNNSSTSTRHRLVRPRLRPATYPLPPPSPLPPNETFCATTTSARTTATVKGAPGAGGRATIGRAIQTTTEIGTETAAPVLASAGSPYISGDAARTLCTTLSAFASPGTLWRAC